jgi:hypothetical protein
MALCVNFHANPPGFLAGLRVAAGEEAAFPEICSLRVFLCDVWITSDYDTVQPESQIYYGGHR